MANCPTGPQPQMAMVSPGWILQNSARHVARRKDVREEQDLLVGQPVRHFDRSDIGIGHAQVFGLTAGGSRRAGANIRTGLRASGPRVSRPLAIGVGPFAAREKSAFAEEAFAAGDGKGNNHAVADLQRLVLRARPPRLRPWSHGQGYRHAPWRG